ncbi:hypothetical protein CR983_03570 [Candidatus Saccharibacteria bacterium]|nr:MAG: hypothetical protein CR983_03570 [Candidatus Saccharibacteria bacterium]
MVMLVEGFCGGNRHVRRWFAVAVCLVAFGGLLMFGLRVLAAPVPVVSFHNAEAQPLIGEDFNFSVQFDNTGDSAGYGPYIDVVVPGDVTLNSAQYVGSGVPLGTPLVFPVGSPACVEHPFAKDNSGAPAQVCLPNNPSVGAKLYAVKLPFGSFVDEQTAADIQFTANMSPTAAIGVAQPITAQGGFYLGQDPLNNPTADPSFSGGQATYDVTPSVMRVSKTYANDYLADEPEITLGPNNTQTFRLSVNIANGATIDNVVIRDTLAAEFTRLGEEAITAGGVDTSSGQDVIVTWPSITGGPGAVDASVNVRFAVPVDANGAPVVGGANGYLNTVGNTATVDGFYQSNALPQQSTSLAAPLNIKPLITQKTVAMQTDNGGSGYTPGDTVRYTIETYVSDYHALGNLQITDVTPDGVTYQTGSSTVELTQAGATNTLAITPTVTNDAPGAGQTTLLYDLSGQGNLLGGCFVTNADPDCAVRNEGRTKIRITFDATIDDTYANNEPIDQNDTLVNDVSSQADILGSDLTDTGDNVGDDSSASLTVRRGSLKKSLYAVNGSTTIPSELAVGDVVTYRLQYDLPSTDVNELKLDDFLPLPMFDASEVANFDASVPKGTIPAAGQSNFGPLETLYDFEGDVPTLSIESGNVVHFAYSAINDANNASRAVDILFSVTISDEAYAPNLSVTNLATATESSQVSDSTSTNALVQIRLGIPQLTVSKGAVASSNPAAVFSPTPNAPVSFNAPGTSGPRFSGTITSADLANRPINSSVSNADGGDITTFAIVIENEGDNLAHEIEVTDSLPAGYVEPAGGYNVRVSNGAGTVLPHTGVGGGSGLFDQGLSIAPELPGGETDGTNVIIITFDAQLDSSTPVGSTLTNTANITKFTAQPTGVNYVSDPTTFQSTADTTTPEPTMTHDITNTADPSTAGNRVAIGEEVTYTTTITLPEGYTPGAKLNGAFSNCLALTHLDSLTPSNGVSTSGDFAAALTNANVTNDGRQFEVDLGNITNADTDNNAPDTLTLVYRGIPTNSSSCNAGNARNANMNFTWDNGSATDRATIRVAEPAVTTAKAFTTSGGDAGDTKTVRLTVRGVSGANRSTAHNVVATDDLSSTNFVYAGNMTSVSGPAPSSMSESGGVVTFGWDNLAPGQTAVVSFDTTLSANTQAGQTYPNTANTTWTSQASDPTGADTYNSLACQRTGDTGGCGGNANDYRSNGSANITVTSLTHSKSIVATSEDSTTGNNAAIGEVVRYRLVTSIPEGSQTDLKLNDQLPNGMSFIDDGSARIALVSTNGAITSSTVNGAGLAVSGGTANINSITPTFTAPGSAISGGPFGSGTDPVFELGDISNTDNDADNEYVVIEFNVLVRDEATNLRGAALTNTYGATVNGASAGANNSTALTVQEPDISLDKTVGTAPVDAGDEVVYHIVITNQNGANVITGHDLSFSDELNTHLQFVAIDNVVSPAYVTLDTSGTSGQNVSASVSELRPGDSVSFDIRATVRDSAPANFIVPNTGEIEASSLPGDGTTPNPTGSNAPADSERTYNGSSTANTQLGPPSVEKQAPNASDYVIGETVEYPIVIRVPEGTTQNVSVSDQLPDGLRYESFTLDTAGFGGSLTNDPPIVATPAATPAATPGADGEDATFNFGTINVSGTNGNYSQFRLLVTARVTDNITAVYEGASLTNSASLTYTDPNTNQPATVNSPTAPSITVHESSLTTTKTLADPTALRHVGDTLSYTTTISNTGQATAYEWQLDDSLPEHTTLEGQPTCTSAGTSLAISTTVANGTLTIRPDPFAGSSLTVGQTVNCTYDLKIETGAVASSNYTNTADADWRSAPSSDPVSRLYDDSVPLAVDGTQDTASADFTMDGASLSKSNGGLDTAVVGQSIPFTLTMSIAAVTANDVTIADTLPAGLVFNNDAVVTGTNGLALTVTGPNDGSAPTTLTWKDSSLISDGSPITITYSVRVANLAPVQNSLNLENSAQLTYVNAANTTITMPAVQSDVDVIEPELSISLTQDNTTPRYGQLVTYSATISHDAASTADAHDPSMSFTIPTGMTFDPGTVNLPPGWTVSVSGQDVTISGGQLPLGDSVTIEFGARVNQPDSAAALGTTLTVSPELTWSSLAGNVGGERTGAGGVDDYQADASSDVTMSGIDMTVQKTTASTSLLPGQSLAYSLDYQNTGNAEARGVVLTETVPAGTTFDAAGSTAGWSCADGAAADTTCTFDVGDVAAGASASVDFAVRILAVEELARDQQTVSNSASINSADDNGPDRQTADNTSSTTTPFEIADIAIDLGLTPSEVVGSKDFTYNLSITNNGPDESTNNVVTAVIPDGVDYVGSSAGCTYDAATRTVTCDLAALGSGDSHEFTIDVTAQAPGEYQLAATVANAQQDPDLDNNPAEISTLVNPVDLEVSQAVDNDRPFVGDEIEFAITVKNNGPDVATDTVLRNFLPANLRALTIETDSGSCDLASLECQLGDLASGQSKVIRIRASVLGAGTFSIRSTVSTTNYDVLAANDLANIELIASTPLTDTGQSIVPLLAGLGLLGSSLAVYIGRRRLRKPQQL